MNFKDYIEEGLGSFRKAYFISPSGKVIDCETSHIQKIIDNPSTFGYNIDIIKSTFEKYNEPLGQEGKAREEIIVNLIKKGWIRIRKYKNFWTININKMNKKVKNSLQEWAEKVQDNLMGFKEKDPYIPVKIEGFNFNDEFTVKDLSNDILYRR